MNLYVDVLDYDPEFGVDDDERSNGRDHAARDWWQEQFATVDRDPVYLQPWSRMIDEDGHPFAGGVFKAVGTPLWVELDMDEPDEEARVRKAWGEARNANIGDWEV